MDKLNAVSYAYHYRNIDSTEHYARMACQMASRYDDGRAEALNNLAFVSLVKMHYDEARQLLDSIPETTDNQIELLVGYIQQMRLCQRQSANREFYDYREQALQALQRINEERSSLDERQQQRLVYAESELAIVNSTYYYYVGLEREGIEAMEAIPADIQRDTAQYLSYLYNVGAGGIVTSGTQEDINQTEFDHLMRCFLLAQQAGYAFFAANSLEALAEHLINSQYRKQLVGDNLPAMKFINPAGVTDDQLPYWLADNALATFSEYGDTYQIAGAYRTLASCCVEQGDYGSALYNLEQALADTLIFQAPDLVASIREQLCVVFAAMDNKPESDRNRNLYLDLQEQTRQDRSLEARASLLEHSLSQLVRLQWAVVGALLLLVAIIVVYYRRARTMQREQTVDTDLQEREEELCEQLALTRLRVENGERRHLEQRAKLSIINGITPLIDRMLHEAARLGEKHDDERLEYIRELADEIGQQNQVLTHWIQLRQGELNLHIETFPLQPLFELLQKSQKSFSMRGLTLDVQSTSALVKADRVLTLFMLNTLADNARKFTPEGGTVCVSAKAGIDYVEIAISDSGIGMDSEQLAHAFDHKIAGDHGFGLLNCKGIIEKYRKLSQIFSVCSIGCESKKGQGSRFFFRLPIGRMAMWITLVCCSLPELVAEAQNSLSAADSCLARAAIYADSAYFSNINGTYERTLLFADSCRQQLNRHFLMQQPASADTLLPIGNLSTVAPEIRWLYDSIDTNFDLILDIRNESAVAALALHEQTLYQYNNRIYTSLFKERSADTTLADHCRKMLQSQANKRVAIILLVVLFVSILVTLLWQVMRLLDSRVRRQQQQQEQLDLLADELQRLTLEENALYVSNAVLDNTLSTLKHETMYFPSRIRQLADQGDTQSLAEVVAYYRELYGMLSAQSMSQADRFQLHLHACEHDVLADETLLRYLLEILRKECSAGLPAISYGQSDGKYVTLRVGMPGLRRTDLFTPSSIANIPYLLCRQIVRDHGEATNRRGCAIRAERDTNDDMTTIIITLPAVWKTSK